MGNFRNGLLTGLVIQFAIGPVFFSVINLALQRTFFDGLVGVVAVTLVDCFYIALAMFGVGKLLENEGIKKVFGVISSLFLAVYGLFIVGSVNYAPIFTANIQKTASMDLFSSFGSVFLITILNPMTIVFFTSLFIAKSIEYNCAKRELIFFGLGTGFATFVFMGTSVVLFSLIKEFVKPSLIQALNMIVGCLLVGYAGVGFRKTVLQDK